MTVTPTGLPIWSRTASFETYGGHTGKKNYNDVGLIDPTTDVSAEQFSREVADIAAMARTSPFAVMTYTQDDTGTNDPTVNYYDAHHGSGAAKAPTLTRNGDGDVTITWDASYSDPYGVSQSVALRHVKATAHGSGNVNAVCDWTPGDRVVRVRCFTADTGAAATDLVVTIEVF